MIYEYPLTEGMRRLLRVEILFKEAEAHIAVDSPYSTLSALRSLLDLVGLVSKNDLKLSLIRVLDQLEKQSGSEEAKRIKMDLNKLSNQSYNILRENNLLNILKQRSAIPGGVCGFDLPLLHNWLHQPHEKRKEHFYHWFGVLKRMQRAVEYALNELRASAQKIEATFERGFYRGSLKMPALLVQIDLDDEPYYPEFNGNHHQLSIRLMHQERPWEEAEQVRVDRTFSMQVCGINGPHRLQVESI